MKTCNLINRQTDIHVSIYMNRTTTRQQNAQTNKHLTKNTPQTSDCNQRKTRKKRDWDWEKKDLLQKQKHTENTPKSRKINTSALANI